MDAVTRLSFAVAENKGVFALLLGSGVSRAASIPTGWEITLDLIRRAAAINGTVEQSDWALWYRERYGTEPDYSELLASLAGTPTERQAIMQEYIEPTEQDREQGLRLPTVAHRSIAQLVARDALRVIVTTNFDRLLENALRDEGVEPTVVSTVDGLAGAEPLAHTRCLILKVHGDYKDARILNTNEELSTYPPQYDKLLDQVFDEYGLVVCGWSGAWDHALRAALQRTPSRRYPLFWASRGPLGENAKQIIASRKAISIDIHHADAFFSSINENVKTIELTRRRHPDGIDLLVGTVKRYIAEQRFKIQLDDLLSYEATRLLDMLSSTVLAMHGDDPTAAEFQRRVAIYKSAAEPLARAFIAIGRWGDGGEFARVVDTIRAAHSWAEGEGSGHTIWLGLRSYPAVLLFRSYSLGLIAAERWSTLHELFLATLPHGDSDAKRMVESLNLWGWKGGSDDFWKLIKGQETKHTPLSNHLFETLENWCNQTIGRSATFGSFYCKYELLSACGEFELESDDVVLSELAKEDGKVRMSVGRYGWKSSDRKAAIEDLRGATVQTALLNAGFANGHVSVLEAFWTNVDRLIVWMNRRGWW